MKKCFNLLLALAMTVMAAQTVMADEVAYKSIGTGWMTDDMITQLLDWEPVTYKVEIQQAEDDSPLYRVIAPYGKNFADAIEAVNNRILTADQYDSEGKCYIDIDATDPDDVIFHKTMTGFNIGSGEIFIGLNKGYNTSLKDGVITSPIFGVAVGMGESAIAANKRGKFRIVMPGVELSDYDITLTPDSYCLTDRTFKANLTVGVGVETIRYAVVADMQEDEMVSYVKEIAKKGGIFTQRGDFTYEMDEVSKETLILVGFNASGDQIGYQWCTYYYIDEDPDGWTDCGLAQFTDGILQDIIANIPSQTTTCMLQESVTTPGRYRLVDPYAGIEEFAALGAKHSDHHHFIYINATDPDYIYLEESPIGLETSKYGLMRVNSYSNYFLQAGFDWEEVVELELGAIVEDGEITFPEEAILFSMTKHESGDWLIVNSEGLTRIKLPEGFDITTGIENVTVSDSASGAPEFFDLRGVKVAKPDHGLYIVRQGKTVSKQLIR